MATWKTGSRLGSFSYEEIEKLKKGAIKYLRDVDYNEELCANKLKLDMLQFGELKAKFSEDFQELHLRIKARMENIMIQVALGKLDAKSTQISTAVKWLERRTPEYKSSSKVTYENKSTGKANGEGRKLLQGFLKDDDKNRRNVLRNQKIQ